MPTFDRFEAKQIISPSAGSGATEYSWGARSAFFDSFLEAQNERLRIASSSWRRRKRKPPGCAIECSIWASARRNSFGRKITGLTKNPQWLQRDTAAGGCPGSAHVRGTCMTRAAEELGVVVLRLLETPLRAPAEKRRRPPPRSRRRLAARIWLRGGAWYCSDVVAAASYPCRCAIRRASNETDTLPLTPSRLWSPRKQSTRR